MNSPLIATLGEVLERGRKQGSFFNLPSPYRPTRDEYRAILAGLLL